MATASVPPPANERSSKRMKEDGQDDPRRSPPHGQMPMQGGPSRYGPYAGGPPPPGYGWNGPQGPPPPHYQGGPPPPHHQGWGQHQQYPPGRGMSTPDRWGNYRGRKPKRGEEEEGGAPPPPHYWNGGYPRSGGGGPPPYWQGGHPPPPQYWSKSTPSPRRNMMYREDYMSTRTINDDDGAGSSAGGSNKEKGRGSYKCGRCGVPKKGHICPYQPKVKRRPDEPPPEMRNAAVQVERDEFMTLRRLNIRIQGFPESYVTEPYMGESMVVGEPYVEPTPTPPTSSPDPAVAGTPLPADNM